jgi:hypothetical protein
MSARPTTTAPRGRPDVALQRVGREAILHDPTAGAAHVINASAARVWELLDGRSIDDVVVAFAAPYDRSPDSVRADVERVLEGFRALGLLDEADAAS